MLVEHTMQRQHGWDRAVIRATPSQTGLDLWRRSIPFDRVMGRSHEYAVVPKELRELIHRTSGQGNFTYPSARSTTLPGMVDLDMRLAYAAAAMEELGCAPAIHDRVPDYAGFMPARYRIQYRVPNGWQHVGLFMTPDPHSRPGNRSWFFPNTHGFVGETWVDASELRVALGPFPHACEQCRDVFRCNTGERCLQHGWPMTILERIVFTKDRPLRTWAEKLVQLRDEVTEAAPTAKIAELASAAVRAILLHTIGALHHVAGIRHSVLQSTTDPDDIPDHTLVDFVPTDDGAVMTWREERMVPTSVDYARPEWSAQIWGRTRARLLLHRDGNDRYTGALTLPYEQIVALRLDALLVIDDPRWLDDGKVGRFRIKGQYPGPVAWPQSEDDLSLLTEVSG
jgi:hypothetical protein